MQWWQTCNLINEDRYIASILDGNRPESLIRQGRRRKRKICQNKQLRVFFLRITRWNK
jgi:hypothetical protein